MMVEREVPDHPLSHQELGQRLAAVPCPYGDGKASERIAALARAYLNLP
jgi:hypothetical protein